MALFSRSDYEFRIHKVKDGMARRGMDVVIVTDPANMNYLTGYDGWSFYVPQVVIVAQSRAEPIWVGRAQDGEGARLTCWMGNGSIRTYADYFVQSSFQHPMDYVAQVLQEEHLDYGYIGVEMDAYNFTAMAHQRLVMHVPQAKILDATALINWVRIVKSNQEMLYIRQAAEIATQAMYTAISGIYPGNREADAAAEVFRSQIRGTAEFSGDYPAIVPLMPSNERTAAAHLTWVDRRYQPGDSVNIELAGCVHRYHAPLCRSVVIGAPSEKLRDLSKVVVEGVNVALDMIRPGVTCDEVERAWQKAITRFGYHKPSRLGYSVGVNYPPDWGEHTASLRTGDLTVLQPNMVFHMIAGMWFEGYGFETSETFAVTPSGCEVLAQVERKLFEVEGFSKDGRAIFEGHRGEQVATDSIFE